MLVLRLVKNMMPEGKVAKIHNYTAIYTQYTKIRLLTLELYVILITIVERWMFI
ncbi:hypothetical protein bsdtb5_02030 [Anaeromicropila herbilytica]|uniref:Uncharacterized protein n=1 Tax=Anaeromicropila herbilytica TaxID=2785025 RepID=A0A7R7IAW7_9FIRM|nr:hypothetical protein bsdtb5_02030 [Anaeromicropila herbilytica]